MNHHGASCRLPVELLSLIFDCLALQELMGASHVARFWREVAFRHRTFWSDITLESLSTTALDFFYARLDAGSTRSITLRVYMCKPRFPARLRSVVLPAISRNLYRVYRLCLETDMAYDHDIFSALLHPAPRLLNFEIYVARNTLPSDALPVDLFAGHAPNLRHIQLVNVQLNADALPRAFVDVAVLKYCYDEHQTFPTGIFSHCRNLRTLIVYGRYCTLVSDGVTFYSADVPKLQFVDLSIDTGSMELLHCLPSASIAQISVPLTDYDLASLVLGHLSGDLDVHLNHTAKDLELLYRSVETGLRRTFICSRAQIDDVYLPPVYVDDGILSRVQTLQSSSTCAKLLPAFGVLPSCTRVALTLADGEPLKPPERPLAMPKLQHIELSSSDTVSMNAEDLAAFLDAAFSPISRAVRVNLNGVRVDGDLAAVPSDRFTVSPEHWASNVRHVTRMIGPRIHVRTH